MQKDTGASPVELFEDRFERLVAHVDATDVGEQNEPVDVQMVTAVGDLCDSGVHVRQRKGGKQPESSAVVDHGTATLLVDLACEVNRGRSVAEVDAGRRDRQQGRGDAESVHDLEVLDGRPLRNPGHAVRLVEARLLQSGPVAIRDVVGMDVDLHSPRVPIHSSRVST